MRYGCTRMKSKIKLKICVCVCVIYVDVCVSHGELCNMHNLSIVNRTLHSILHSMSHTIWSYTMLFSFTYKYNYFTSKGINVL